MRLNKPLSNDIGIKRKYLELNENLVTLELGEAHVAVPTANLTLHRENWGHSCGDETKGRCPLLTVPFQHSTTSHSQYNNDEDLEDTWMVGGRRLFTDDTLAYVENPKELTRKTTYFR